MNTCEACQKRGKTWSGDNPRCGFTGGQFGDNWNCETANLIRDFAEENYVFCDDQKYSTLNIDGVELLQGSPLALWVTWYKRRGTTDAMWILWSDRPPSLPTEDDCVAIVAYLGSRK